MARLPDLHNRAVRLSLTHIATGDPDGLRWWRSGLLNRDGLLLHDNRLLLHDDRLLLHDRLLNDNRLRLHHNARRVGFHSIVNCSSDKTTDKTYARTHPEGIRRTTVMMMVVAPAMPVVMRTVMPGKCGSRQCDGGQAQQQLFHFIISFSWVT